MEPIKVLVVEDKLLVAEDISAALADEGMEVLAVYDTGEEAVEALAVHQPDLVLMDIELAGKWDGITTAERIKERVDIPIIFLTEFSDSRTVGMAIKTQPANYLTKPFNKLDLVRAVELAFFNSKNEKAVAGPALLQGYVFVRTDTQSFIKIAIQDIIYLEADRAYCNVITQRQKFKLSTSMKHIEQQINHRDFVRVHRSFIINVNTITAIEGNVILMGEEHQVQMSKEYREDLMRQLKFIK